MNLPALFSFKYSFRHLLFSNATRHLIKKTKFNNYNFVFILIWPQNCYFYKIVGKGQGFQSCHYKKQSARVIKTIKVNNVVQNRLKRPDADVIADVDVASGNSNRNSKTVFQTIKSVCWLMKQTTNNGFSVRPFAQMKWQERILNYGLLFAGQ